MISIVLTNRNRNLIIVKKCLDSLKYQCNTDFELFFVDYGSKEEYLLQLEELLANYSNLKFIACPVSDQLWNKSRAINIAFFVGDIDMIFHSEFVKKLYIIKDEQKVIYFQVGFLSQKETFLNKEFDNANIAFTSQKEATGMTLYPTKILQEINGYDEFYHGWGAEDTDVHVRMHNFGVSINFFNHEILLKHQWHPKTYRTHLNMDPYHFKLEKINHSYIKISEISNKVQANLNFGWGLIPNQNQYSKLYSDSDFYFDLLSEDSKINAVIAQLYTFKNKTVSIVVKEAQFNLKIKQVIKKIIGLKHLNFLPMKNVNDILLQEIIVHYRNLPYKYSFDQNKKEIHLKIYFPV